MWSGLRRSKPSNQPSREGPAAAGSDKPVVPRRRRVADPPAKREVVQARVEVEHVTAAGEALDALGAAVFAGAAGRARVEPLLAVFDEDIGRLEPDDPDFDLLQVSRMDHALCDVPATPDAAPGDTWAWRAIHGRVPGVAPIEAPSQRAAARAIVGLFEVYPGTPTWVRDRVSGLVVRLLDAVGPLDAVEPGQPAALWELRLVPGVGGFSIARIPIDYPIELLDALDDQLARRFEASPWPTLQDLRRARLRYLRAGARTPIGRMLRWK